MTSNSKLKVFFFFLIKIMFCCPILFSLLSLYIDKCSFQEVLSIAVGPRSEEEVFTVQQIVSLLDKVGQTLRCRKVQTCFPSSSLLIFCSCYFISLFLFSVPFAVHVFGS